MRAVPLFLFALMLIAPASLVGGNAGAEAASRKGSQARKTKKKAAARKPVIKLRETPGTSEPEAKPQGSAPPQRGPTRIDFDDRLVQGQTNRSGSVYLYDRKELKTRSMVKKRESFREQIVDAVYE